MIEVQPADLAKVKGNREEKHIIGGEPALLLTNRGGNAIKKRKAPEKEQEWMSSREKNGSSRRKTVEG